jgi:hypothetical protein
LAREAPAAAEFVHLPGISAVGQPTAEQMQAADAPIDVSSNPAVDSATG